MGTRGPILLLAPVFVWDFSSAAADDSLKFLLELAQTIGKRPILIPTSDVTASFCRRKRPAPRRPDLFAIPSPEVVDQFSCKKRTYDLCQKLGVPTAVTALVQSKEEVLDFARSWKFPVIVKGQDGAFLLKKNENARVAIISGKEELLNIFDLNSNGRDPGLILQRYIAGDDATVWMFNGYFNEQSDCLFVARPAENFDSFPHTVAAPAWEFVREMKWWRPKLCD